VKVIEKNATGLVELIEKGIFSGEKIENILKKNLNPMIQNKIDHLVLGCTHYPILIKTIKSLIPSHIKILDSGKAVAKQTNRLLIKNKLESNLIDPSYTFYCNGSDQSLNKILNFKFAINII
jgi:glutamate racemase